MGGHALVYKICTESSQPKDAESQCYTLYLDYCRGICGQFDGKERRTAFTALKGIFKYLDQHFTDTKDRPGMVRSKQPTSKLCAGQDLKTSADAIAADDCWIPDYQAAPVVEAAPVAAEVQAPPVAEEAPAAPAAGLYRAASAPRTLSRATSISTLNNIGDLKAWVATKSDKWVSGESLTPAEMSEGHALVYKICTKSSQPKDAENQCYTLYLDYCRGICGQFDGKERRTAFTALKGIFKYLDQHFTNSKDRPGMVRSKQPPSKLCAGQDLKTSADAITADDCWIPDYQAAPVVEAAPAAPAVPVEAAAPVEAQTAQGDSTAVADSSPPSHFAGFYNHPPPREFVPMPTLVVSDHLTTWQKNRLAAAQHREAIRVACPVREHFTALHPPPIHPNTRIGVAAHRYAAQCNARYRTPFW